MVLCIGTGYSPRRSICFFGAFGVFWSRRRVGSLDLVSFIHQLTHSCLFLDNRDCLILLTVLLYFFSDF